jgi:DNA-binding transcriptional LysR family regulator
LQSPKKKGNYFFGQILNIRRTIFILKHYLPGDNLMKLDNLKAFCVAVESGSISKAARKLYISQPSLSVKIQELENYYEAKLFHRTNRGINPTEAGLIVYDYAKKMLTLSDSVERSLEQTNNEAQQLIVGTSSTIGNFALPCTVYNFNEKYPHYKVSLIISNTDKVLSNLITHKVDLGLIEGPVTRELKNTLLQEGINTRSIITNALILVVPNNETWQNISRIHLEQIKELPINCARRRFRYQKHTTISSV